MKKLIIVIIILILIALIGVIVAFSVSGTLSDSVWTPDPLPIPVAPTPPAPGTPAVVETLSGWEPGTYTGVGQGGFGGDISVEVLVDDNGNIASITLTDHNETQSFLIMAEAVITGAIIGSQEIHVDTFAGATMTSEAIINAVADALDGAEITAAPADVITDAAVGGGWIPGTYTGTGGGGFSGDVSVEVIINNAGQIESIIVTEHSETQSFMIMAEAVVIGSIITSQTTDVDTFAGATMSSEAIINAVKDALSGAEG